MKKLRNKLAVVIIKIAYKLKLLAYFLCVHSDSYLFGGDSGASSNTGRKGVEVCPNCGGVGRDLEKA